MDEDDVRPSGGRATFVASHPRSAGAESDPTAHRIGSATTFLPAPTRFSDFTGVEYKAGERAFAAIIFAAIGLVIIPEVINYLLVKHVPDQSIDRALASAETPIAGLARWALSGVLLAVSSLVLLMRGHPNRDVTWLLVFLMALNLPYLIGPDQPGPADLVKIMLANLVLLAIWHTGARVVVLKWIPILVSGVGAYSLIGGLIIPEYMMYNIVSRKSLVFGWELAGPFGQSNALGMYCAVAFSLVPLIGQNRWRAVCASILLATIVASASRTALVAVAVVVLWWLICRLRSVISIRLAGTVLAGTALAAAMVIPLLRWSPGSFTERAFIWAGGLELWRDAPVVGSGYNWFLQHGQEQAEIVLWAGMGTGHNIHIDTLIKFGLAGLAFLLPIWIGAIYVTGTMRVINEQVALFGYLIAFFVLGMTEAVWHLWPNIQQFPTSTLIFATVLMARNRGRTPAGAM
ncbi:O-antigen ligase family protein [Mycolicibacterium parafortuitum]|uniref:O-antigen ligase family protein n=1 Tax=Mycolicibacterium parafortuitum TaxID=39692 RepID=UPI0009F407A3|nr:O-antigen ligase family protein [Mycolicibacterium parafortuitum]